MRSGRRLFPPTIVVCGLATFGHEGVPRAVEAPDSTRGTGLSAADAPSHAGALRSLRDEYSAGGFDNAKADAARTGALRHRLAVNRHRRRLRIVPRQRPRQDPALASRGNSSVPSQTGRGRRQPAPLASGVRQIPNRVERRSPIRLPRPLHLRRRRQKSPDQRPLRVRRATRFQVGLSGRTRFPESL